MHSSSDMQYESSFVNKVVKCSSSSTSDHCSRLYYNKLDVDTNAKGSEELLSFPVVVGYTVGEKNSSS